MVRPIRSTRCRVTGGEGSASVILLCLGIAVVLLAMGVLRVGVDLVNVRRLARVADLAALAAARQVLLGGTIACEAAHVVATANDAELSGCRTDELDVVVGVRVSNSVLTELIGGATAVARAGPAMAPEETSAGRHWASARPPPTQNDADQASSLGFSRSSGRPASCVGASSSRSATHS